MTELVDVGQRPLPGEEVADHDPSRATGVSPRSVPSRHTSAHVGGPVRVAWREGTLTRAKEIESLVAWSRRHPDPATGDERGSMDALEHALGQHLQAARDAAAAPRSPLRNGWRIERAMSNLDAAEADMLQLANADYLLGQLSNIVNHVQRHLRPGDRRRTEVEWVVERLRPANGKDHSGAALEARNESRRHEVLAHRHSLVSAYRGASSAALREQTQVRSFRNVLVLATVGMTLVAIALILVGAARPSALPLCFAPQDGDEFMVVCPTESSMSMPLAPATSSNDADIDAAVQATTTAFDIGLVAIVGVTAAAIAAAAAVRGIRGSSEPYGVPLALAVLKLPTGAVTAILGIVLMRGQFIPGLSALDSSAQILAWAAIFGYAQQLFTRLVDQQAHAVLDGVRGSDKAVERTPSA